MTNKIFNYSRIEIFLIISYLICWFSISTSFNDILNFTKKETIYFNDIINFFRQFLNLIIFPVLFIILIKEFKKYKI